MGISAVQGRTQVAGSSTMNVYMMSSSATRVNRSTTRIRSLDPRNGFLPLMLVVSTTSVSPSHRPRGTPIHCRVASGAWGRSSRGMMRALWSCSSRIITWSRFCTMWKLAL